jgi:hypothetical protein
LKVDDGAYGTQAAFCFAHRNPAGRYSLRLGHGVDPPGGDLTRSLHVLLLSFAVMPFITKHWWSIINRRYITWGY